MKEIIFNRMFNDIYNNYGQTFNYLSPLVTMVGDEKDIAMSEYKKNPYDQKQALNNFYNAADRCGYIVERYNGISPSIERSTRYTPNNAINDFGRKVNAKNPNKIFDGAFTGYPEV